mgnify:CR=1 FL=1
MQNDILSQNRNSWNAMADEWFGVTALPVYGCLIPTETELNLFGDVNGKCVLDIGCGSGHSPQYYAPCKAKKFPLSFIIKARKR